MTPKEVLENGIPAVFLTTSKECKDILAKVGIHFDGDVELEEIYFCKVETQQDSVYGTLCVPRLLDVLGSRYKLQFFINEKYIVMRTMMILRNGWYGECQTKAAAGPDEGTVFI